MRQQYTTAETTFVYLSPAKFVKLVAAMRAEQKLYFRTRSQTALRESKRLEKAVDEFIDHWLEAGESL